MTTIIASANMFGQSYLITQGAPGTETRTAIYQIAETGLRNFQMGSAAAMSYVLTFFLILLSLVVFWLFREQEGEADARRRAAVLRRKGLRCPSVSASPRRPTGPPVEAVDHAGADAAVGQRAALRGADPARAVVRQPADLHAGHVVQDAGGRHVAAAELVPAPVHASTPTRRCWPARRDAGAALVRATACWRRRCTPLLVVATAALAAYAAGPDGVPRASGSCSASIIATLFVPPVILIIPNYLIVGKLGWLDTPDRDHRARRRRRAFGVFFLRQFFLGLPVELEEAALLDGANRWQIFWQVVLPLSRPALVTLAMLAFLTN